MENEQLIHQVLTILKNEISQIKDLDSLLEKILFESRKFTSADAGSLFLVEGNKLKFSYVQNDSLFKDLTFKKHIHCRIYSADRKVSDDRGCLQSGTKGIIQLQPGFRHRFFLQNTLHAGDPFENRTR